MKTEKIKEVLTNHEEIVAAYIFGSYATGENRESSDLDVAIILQEDFNPEKFYLSKLSLELDKVIGVETQIII
ncbi:hypothetical protein BVX95_01130 [archaeon D22]|nr:hypothetical protein BVX95_01130 [archaeon D22]